MKGEPRRASALGVMMHGKQIGTILRLAGDRQVFSFEQSYPRLVRRVEGMGGAWIVKLPSPVYEGVAENEFVMLELAREIGLVVPRIRLVPVKEIEGLPMVAQSIRGNALAVERFDRGVGGGRINMEDFAQVFGQFPEDKYKAVSYANTPRVLWQETGQEGAYEFIRRLTFSVLIGNADMHLKNWSILYPDQRRAVLAPAYDFVSTVPYISEDKLALSFGGGRSLAGISFDQVRRLTEKAGMPLEPVLALVRETAEAVVEKWRGLRQRDALPRVIDAAIDLQIEKAARGIQVRG